MKKILLSIAILLLLVGCNNKNDSEECTNKCKIEINEKETKDK